MTMLKVHHSVVSHDVPTYIGMSLTGGSWPRSPTSIIEHPPKGVFMLLGKASRRQSSMRANIFGPMKLISTMRIYCTWSRRSCRIRRDWPSRGCIVVTGMRSAECIVSAFMLNVATPVGARRSKGFVSFVEFSKSASLRKPIK